MNRTTRLSDIISPQIGAVSGVQVSPLHESDFIEGQAEYAPQIEEAEYRRQMYDEENAINEEQRREQSRDSGIALGLEGVNTGIKAAPLISKYAPGFLSKLGAGAGKTALDTSGNTLAVEAGSSGASTAAPGILTKGAGYVSSLAPYAAPVGAGMIGADLGGEHFTREVGKDVSMGLAGHKQAQENVGRIAKGAAAGAATGAAIGSFGGPIGTVAGGILGAFGGWLKGL